MLFPTEKSVVTITGFLIELNPDTAQQTNVSVSTGAPSKALITEIAGETPGVSSM